MRKRKTSSRRISRFVTIAVIVACMFLAGIMVAMADGPDTCALTVHFDGVTIVSASVQTASGTTIASCGSKTDSAAFTVPQGTGYRVVLRQGSHYETVTGVDCSGETQSVTDLVCAVTAQFPGVTIVSGQVKDISGNSLVSCGSKTDSAVFNVLRGSGYQVVLRQGNHYKTVTGVNCSGETQTVTDLVSTLTAQFPGVTIVSGEVKDGSGSSLVSCGSKTDSAVFTVLRGEDYQVVLRQGNHYKTVTGVDCSGEEQTVTDLVSTLTAQFPGVTIVSGEVKDGSGSSLVSCSSKTDSAVFTVLRGSGYQVVLRQGNHYKTVTGVDCSGEEQTVTDLVSTLTAQFPGVTIVSGEVKDGSGSSLVSCGSKTDSAVFTVLREAVIRWCCVRATITRR